MLRDIQTIADRVARALTRKGQPGTFHAFEAGLAVRVRWDGARADLGDAERALCAALTGYDAQPMPGLGVWVQPLERAVNDHEGALHNAEPAAAG
jgi:hypothetical protein